MSQAQDGMISQQRSEHRATPDAKAVLLLANDGGSYVEVAADSGGNLQVGVAAGANAAKRDNGTIADATTIDGTYKTLLTLNNVTTVRAVSILYTGDIALFLSFDGGTNESYIPPYSSFTEPLSILGLKETNSTLQVKRDGAVSPSRGSIWASVLGV